MILITGGTGMVGGEVVRLLSQQGVAAQALARAFARDVFRGPSRGAGSTAR